MKVPAEILEMFEQQAQESAAYSIDTDQEA